MEPSAHSSIKLHRLCEKEARSNMRSEDILAVPELDALNLPAKPDGPGAAAMLSAGIGIFVLGLLTTLNEAWAALHDFLGKFEAGRGVGPLAGKTIIAVAAWAVSWAVLGTAWRGKDVDIRRMFTIGLILGIIGGVLTFPTFFEMFAE